MCCTPMCFHSNILTTQEVRRRQKTTNGKNHPNWPLKKMTLTVFDNSFMSLLGNIACHYSTVCC